MKKNINKQKKHLNYFIFSEYCTLNNYKIRVEFYNYLLHDEKCVNVRFEIFQVFFLPIIQNVENN